MPKPFALVIEDDYDGAIIMAEALRAADYEVEVIHDGREALAALTRLSPDLITLDLHLPAVSGRELLEQIRADDRFRQTRIMLVSADDRLASQLDDQSLLVLLKPVSFTQLSMLARRFRPQDPDRN